MANNCMCVICGETKRILFRNRSRMFLCGSCHKTTPTKVWYWEFLDKTGMFDSAIAKEFFSDYKTSTFGSVAEYWKACSSKGGF